jgi:hypothetical protein
MARAPLAFLLVFLACAPTKTAAPPPPPEPARSDNARSAHLVSATVVANECGAVSKANAKRAEDAMHKLVEGCTSVPGGSQRFAATLQPGGRIEIAQTGASEVVPICVLKNELRHTVPLTQSCKLEVRLEEGTIALPNAAAN